MRSTLAYTSARILLFIVAAGIFYLIGARGLTLLVLALLVSGIVSLVVLSRARDRMSSSLSASLTGARSRLSEFSDRLDEGATAEDVEDTDDVTGTADGGDTSDVQEMNDAEPVSTADRAGPGQ